VTARERAACRDVPDEVINQDRDRPDGIPVATPRHVQRKVQALRWSASPGQEHLDVIGHPGDELGPVGRTDERTTVLLSEQHGSLGEPATHGDAVWRLQGADSATTEHGPAEADLECAHPAGAALGAYPGSHPRYPDRRRRRADSRRV
jgi:hypothetical protein